MTAIEGRHIGKRVSGLVRRFALDCSGGAAVEYALVAAGICAAVIALAQVVSGGISDWTGKIAEILGNK